MFDQGQPADWTQLQAALEQSQRQLRAVQEAMSSLTVSAESPDRMLSLTLDSGGRVQEFVVRDDGYVDLRPDELAEKVTSLFLDAQGQLHEALVALAPANPWNEATPGAAFDLSADLSSLMPDELIRTISQDPRVDDGGGRRG